MAELQLDELRHFARALGLAAEQADEVVGALHGVNTQLTFISNYSMQEAKRLLVRSAFGAFRPRPTDQQVYDATPDDCWRCDATEGQGPLGLCAPCLADLVQR
jgi:hypothetical protein